MRSLSNKYFFLQFFFIKIYLYMKIASSLILIVLAAHIFSLVPDQRFVMQLQQAPDGTVCTKGMHLDNDLCISNEDWCDEFNNETLSCDSCSFWVWEVESQEQGNWCATHWWAVFLICLAILLGVLLCVGLCAWLALKAGQKSSAKPKGRAEDIRDERYEMMNKSHSSRSSRSS